MMLKAIALACVGFAVVSAPGHAQQSAPISKGVTSSDLAAQVQQARQQSAALTVNVNALQGEVTTLTGRIEELEFKLRQAHDRGDQLARDNEALVDEISALQLQSDQQARTIDALFVGLVEAGIAVERPQMVETYPGASDPGAFTTAAADPADEENGGMIGRSLSNVGPQSLVTRAQQAAAQEQAAIEGSEAATGI